MSNEECQASSQDQPRKEVDVIDDKLRELRNRASKCFTLARKIDAKLFGAQPPLPGEDAKTPEEAQSSVIMPRWIHELQRIENRFENTEIKLAEILKRL